MPDRKFTPPTEFPAEYVTSEGRKAVIIGIMPDPYFPLIGYIIYDDGQCGVEAWDDVGSYEDYGVYDSKDLHDLPKKQVHHDMTDLDAIMIAEGVDAVTLEEQKKAWQHLHDTGLAYKLQGWYGRTAQHLIAEGIIQE